MEDFEAAFDVERVEVVADRLDPVKRIDQRIAPCTGCAHMVIDHCLRLQMFLFKLLHLRLEHRIGDEQRAIKPEVKQFIFLLLDAGKVLLQRVELVGSFFCTIFLRKLKFIDGPLHEGTREDRIVSEGKERVLQFLLREAGIFRTFDSLLPLRTSEKGIWLLLSYFFNGLYLALHDDHPTARCAAYETRIRITVRVRGRAGMAPLAKDQLCPVEFLHADHRFMLAGIELSLPKELAAVEGISENLVHRRHGDFSNLFLAAAMMCEMPFIRCEAMNLRDCVSAG